MHVGISTYKQLRERLKQRLPTFLGSFKWTPLKNSYDVPRTTQDLAGRALRGKTCAPKHAVPLSSATSLCNSDSATRGVPTYCTHWSAEVG